MLLDKERSGSNYLLTLATAIVVLLLCGSTVYLPHYLNFNADEARIVIDLDKLAGGWFAEHPLRIGTHLGSELQYYLLPKVTFVTVRTLRAVAAAVLVLTLVYVFWLGRAYALLRSAGLVVLVLLISTNGGLIHYGQWGVFDYSERILVSVFLLHMLLFLHRRGLNLSNAVFGAAVSGFCLLTAAYAEFVVPIVALVAVAVRFRQGSKPDTAAAEKSALRNGLVMLVSVIVVGLITLKYAAHPEFRDPRPEIRHFFFPFSGYPRTPAGLLKFLASATVTFLATTFYTFPPVPGSSIWGPSFNGAGGLLTLVVTLGFIIGVSRSLVAKPRDATRFVIAAYVCAVLACLASLSVVGLYAFGDIRYALFIYVPLLIVTAYGIMDVAGWLAQLLPSSLVRSVGGLGSPILVGVALLVAAGAATVGISEKRVFNVEFTKLIKVIETDASPRLFDDTFAEWGFKVLGMAPSPNRQTFQYDFTGAGRPYYEFVTFATSPQDVLWVTNHLPWDEPLFAPYAAALQATHFRAQDLSVPPWRLTRWTSWDSAPHVTLPLRLDFGDNSARQWMREGWQADEVSSGRTFTWSNGPRSVLTIPLPRAANARMDFEALPFTFQGSPPQHVTIVLNGVVVKDVPLQPGLQRYSVNLPGAALRQSLDTLEFHYAYARAPRDVIRNSVDERELAVAWYLISFAPLEPPPGGPVSLGGTAR